VNLSDCVTGDLLRVTLAADHDRLRFPEPVAEVSRGALLTDLALLGRLTSAADESEVDTTATGLAVIDELVSGVQEHPDRTMEWWLRRGHPHLHELVAELIAEGCWPVERHGVITAACRYVDRDGDRMWGVRRRLADVVAGHVPTDHREAALAVLASLTGALEPLTESRRDELVRGCGRVGWMVRGVVDYLAAAQEDDAAAATVNATTYGIQGLSI
jgi:hypothetical protein